MCKNIFIKKNGYYKLFDYIYQIQTGPGVQSSSWHVEGAPCPWGAGQNSGVGNPDPAHAGGRVWKGVAPARMVRVGPLISVLS